MRGRRGISLFINITVAGYLKKCSANNYNDTLSDSWMGLLSMTRSQDSQACYVKYNKEKGFFKKKLEKKERNIRNWGWCMDVAMLT